MVVTGWFPTAEIGVRQERTARPGGRCKRRTVRYRLIGSRSENRDQHYDQEESVQARINPEHPSPQGRVGVSFGASCSNHSFA